MVDQAHALRTLMKQRRSTEQNSTSVASDQIATVLGITSAKGGVGKTTIALQLAEAISREGKKVCVWDVGGDSSHDLLGGFHHSWTLSHVLTGARTSADAVTSGPEGVDYLLGSGVANLTSALSANSQSLQNAIQSWEQSYDVIILDLPSAAHPDVQSIIAACDAAWMICTTEPAAVAATYGLIKNVTAVLGQMAVLVNQSDSPELAFEVIDRLRQTTELFLQQNLDAVGFVPRDSTLQPFTEDNTHSPGRTAIQTLAGQWLKQSLITKTRNGFMQRYHGPEARTLEDRKAA